MSGWQADQAAVTRVYERMAAICGAYGPTGPLFDRLLDGEVERARPWGVALGEVLARRAPEREATPA